MVHALTEDGNSAVNSIRVILVDDEPNQMELAKLNLEEADPVFTITLAPMPADALNLLFDQTFDCIVSDFIMQGMNGIESLY